MQLLESIMTSKTIIFHIGHGKTGSSALQSLLAKNHEVLKQHGYLYPYHSNFKNATRGFISAGNITPAKDPDWLQNQVISVVNSSSEYHTFIYSAEALFNSLSPLFQQYQALPASWSVKVLLAVRNPIEMMASHHQQAVKRGGYSGCLKQFMEEHNYKVRALHNSVRVLEKLEKSQILYSLANYSRVRMNIAEFFLGEMGLAGLVNASEERERLVNRSLSSQELSLVAFINTVVGPKAGFKLSDSFVNQIPSIKADNLFIDQGDIDALIENNSEALLQVNKRLGSSMGLTFDYVPTVSFDIQKSLNDEQVQIAKNLLFGISERRKSRRQGLNGE